MISCEEFETLYPFVETEEVLLHRKNCPYCSQFADSTAILRRHLAALPRVNTPVGFEFRLERRLKGESFQSAKAWKAAPRALAFASGIAVVLIAGAVYRNSQMVQPAGSLPMAAAPAQDSIKSAEKLPIVKEPATEAVESEEEQLAEVQTDSTAAESLKVHPNSPWGGSLIEAVSARK